MIARITAIEQKSDTPGFRICFVDDTGRNWYVGVPMSFPPEHMEAIVSALRAMDLMARDPEKAIEMGWLKQDDLDKANADRDKREFEKFAKEQDGQPGTKKWMM